jgi:hypothetical protein
MASADPQARIAVLERALNAAQRELNSTSHELHWAQLTIQKKDAVIRLLEERLRKQRIGQLGPPSETLSDLQLELLVEQEPSASREEVEAESWREPLAEPRKRQSHPGRKPLPEALPRIEEVIPCKANCSGCGVNVRLTQVARSERLVGRVDRIQVAGWTRMNRMSHRRCLPEAVGRPPAKAFSNTSRSSLSSTFMRIQFGRGRLLKPAT